MFNGRSWRTRSLAKTLVLCRVLLQVGVWNGDQDHVVLVVVDPDILQPTITIGVIIHHVLGIVHNDDHANLFLVRLPSPPDVDRFHGHSWTWCREDVFFHRVLRLVHAPEFDLFIDQAPIQNH